MDNHQLGCATRESWAVLLLSGALLFLVLLLGWRFRIAPSDVLEEVKSSKGSIEGQISEMREALDAREQRFFSIESRLGDVEDQVKLLRTAIDGQ